GSTTKLFVAMAIMQLIEEGYFSLQSKVSELAPEINIDNPWHETSPIRVVHLLEHTAGFDDMHFKNFYNKTGQEVNLLESVNRDAESLAVR
ncbi:serine hydrolase, partial [Pseudoalteromonas piscicida]|uniref:serine hydrolase n=1 Tax=Pseudoalteromonas piscicida TaxID=43662 RepID=UPI00110A1E20